MEKKTQDVMRILKSVGRDFEKFEEQYGVMSRHISNAYNSTSTLGSMMNQLGQKLDQTKMLGESE